MKAFDFFQKVQQDQTLRKTTIGGLLFIFTVLVMLILSVNEIYLCLIKGDIQVESFVDTSNIDQRIRVNLNITLGQIPCDALSVNIQDVTGAHLEDLKHTLHKIRLYKNGSFINGKNAEKIQKLERFVNYPSHPIIRFYKKLTRAKDIDDCYGAQIYEGQRCVTCQDVMLAYASRDWPQPPKEAIAQCMPDRKPLMKYQNIDSEFEEALLQQQEEVLQSISQQLKEIEEREKRNEELERKQKQKDEVEKSTEPVLKDILSDHQKKHFKETLQALSEMSYNPMQWNPDRLRQEKLAHVDSLIHMLNISLDDYTSSLQGELLITERKLQSNITNITTLYRAKCDDHIRIFLNISYEGENNIINENSTYTIEMANGTCSMSIFYETLEQEDDQISIQITLDNQTYFPWRIRRSGERKSLITTFIISIASLTLVNQESMTLFQKKGLIDITSSTFRFSVYVPIQMTTQQNRILYQEDFHLSEKSTSYIYENDIQEIEEHINEGCQIYGHLFIKRVPGNLHIGFHNQGKLSSYLANRFSVSHTIHLLEFTDEKEEISLGRYIPTTNSIDNQAQLNKIDEDSNYYLKIVGSIYENKRMYTFTSHHQKSDQKQMLPSVVFRYEFDPITMRYKSKYSNLLISFLAIIGGVYSISLMCSNILQSIGW